MKELLIGIIATSLLAAGAYFFGIEPRIVRLETKKEEEIKTIAYWIFKDSNLADEVKNKFLKDPDALTKIKGKQGDPGMPGKPGSNGKYSDVLYKQCGEFNTQPAPINCKCPSGYKLVSGGGDCNERGGILFNTYRNETTWTVKCNSKKDEGRPNNVRIVCGR